MQPKTAKPPALVVGSFTSWDIRDVLLNGIRAARDKIN